MAMKMSAQQQVLLAHLGPEGAHICGTLPFWHCGGAPGTSHTPTWCWQGAQESLWRFLWEESPDGTATAP